MHRLKLHKALCQSLSLTYFKPRSFSIIGPATFKVTNPYTQEVLSLFENSSNNHHL